MKTVSSKPFSTSQEIGNGGHLLPAGTWKPTGFEPELIQTNHPFLRQLLQNKMPIFKCQGELTVFVARSILWLRVYEDHIRIEYMATYADKRREKSGTYSMGKLCAIADATHTTLRLTTDVITKLECKKQIPTHPVITHAINGKIRIPAPALVKWFQTFGFVKGERSTSKEVDYRGYHMERTPQPIEE